MTAIVRKKKVEIDKLSPSQLHDLLNDYLTTNFTYYDLAIRYNLVSEKSVRDYINKIITKLNIVKETASLHPTDSTKFQPLYKPTNLINEPFLEKLSPPNEALTDEELLYCYLFVYTGDNQSAIEQSGLDAGCNNKKLIKDSQSYEYALRVRGLHLRNKLNIREHINQLRLEKLKNSRDVNKVFVVEELVEQLEQLKEDGREKKLILDTIKLLGQTCGAFSERIEVTQIDPSKPLVDSLINMALREAKGLETPDAIYEITDVGA